MTLKLTTKSRVFWPRCRTPCRHHPLAWHRSSISSRSGPRLPVEAPPPENDGWQGGHRLLVVQFARLVPPDARASAPRTGDEDHLMIS